MSILPDWKIEDLCQDQSLTGRPPLISPFSKNQLQPASYDLRLWNQFRVPLPNIEVIDPLKPGSTTNLITIGHLGESLTKPWPEWFIIHPNEFVLASTVERFNFPGAISPGAVAGQLGGKSSLGRLGLQVHSTAGFFDPGFVGDATLELSNVSRHPIRLYPGMLIAQMVFLRLEGVPERMYGDPGLNSKYSHQRGPMPSRYHEQPSD